MFAVPLKDSIADSMFLETRSYQQPTVTCEELVSSRALDFALLTSTDDEYCEVRLRHVW